VLVTVPAHAAVVELLEETSATDSGHFLPSTVKVRLYSWATYVALNEFWHSPDSSRTDEAVCV
jgi:hypothetical protein